jgi:hypothetical protein
MSARRPADDHRAETEGRDEHGFVAVWLALALFLMLGVAAVAVDLVHGILVGQEAQNAADAASLAGVTNLPQDPTGATADALASASQNGFTNGVHGVTVTAVQQTIPTQLKVEVKQTVPTFFARAIGFDTLTVRKTAIADYDQPVSMGSPANTFGNQPDCVGMCTNTNGAQQPDLWFNIAGPDSKKVQGDAYAARLCKIDGDPAPDECPGTGAGNTDYDGKGYDYTIRNTNAGGTLRVDVFDPAFVQVGDTCGDAGLTALYNQLNAANYADKARYTPGAADSHCSGDVFFGYASNYTNQPPVTRYQLYYDPDTPWTDDDDVLQTGCSKDYNGVTGDLAARWNAENAPGSTLEKIVTQQFRKWVTVCTVNGAQKGDYVLRITTLSGTGHNRGSIRAAMNNSLTSNALSVFARGRMSIYANKIGASTQFYLARVLPGAAGRKLVIKFFDTGDASQAGTIKILPPNDPGAAPASFSGCTYTPPSQAGPPWVGDSPVSGSDCSQSGVQASAGWNGQWVQWTVPIPSNYTCSYQSSTGCWIKLQFQYPGGNVADTTTWTARLTGNPVRIVQ